MTEQQATFWKGVATGVAGVVVLKYVVLGHDRWDDLLEPLHRLCPNRKPDCTCQSPSS